MEQVSRGDVGATMMLHVRQATFGGVADAQPNTRNHNAIVTESLPLPSTKPSLVLPY